MSRLRAAAIAVAVLLLASAHAHASPAKLVKDIERSSIGCGVSDFLSGPGGVWFGTDARCRQPRALFRSDGTAAGTRPLTGRQIPCLVALAATGDSLFVPSMNARWGSELWSVPLDPP